AAGGPRCPKPPATSSCELIPLPRCHSPHLRGGLSIEGGWEETGSLDLPTSNFQLAAPHAIPTVVAQIAVAVSHRDGAAVVAARGVGLEAGELFAAGRVGLGLVRHP